jgi:isoleucyl-tRNA synthetase
VIFRATPQWFIAMDQVHSDLVEKDEDGRDRSNFTDNLPETPEKSLRGGALAEIERVKWIPGWGVDRMRNMLKGRPDWCVSRQRVWGVNIPVFYCARCNEAVSDPAVINHVADIFERESGDAWYTRSAEELLPEGYACKCGTREFTKESDILDVWFDSGTSSIAVLENREELRWPADVYIEGGDQFRGWFNSSLMIGIAAHNRAPYKTVITHGWTLDAQGRAMHKSAGNAIEPEKVIKQSGAETIRLWCASSNYFDDMRGSDEILQRVTDGYRKLRNTARFALGNLAGFDPARDSVPFEEMEEIDRWALAELNRVTTEVLAAYEAYEFHNVYRALFNFSTVTLSARYFDIIKDRLYTFAPRNKARRSAQTALLQIGDALARMLAPILVFTADEIWENLPNREEPSIHLALLPKADAQSHDALLAEWERLFAIRDDVLRALEEARVAKQIGSSLQAKVTLQASGSALELLQKHQNDLRYLFIVSQVELGNSTGGEGVSITISNAAGEKCERCWNYSTRVGESEVYPTVCERCVTALKEIEQE